MPCSATSRRREPSKENGSVTTPTVSAPFLRAISATVADAPVPVPPPIPAVMNTMSELSRRSAMFWRLSFTARLPTSGRPPDPMPFTVLGADGVGRDCLEVGERLNVGVQDEGVNGRDAAADHARNGVAARAADADDSHLDVGRGGALWVSILRLSAECH